MTGKCFPQVSLKRKDEAVTFAVMKKAIKLDSGEKLHISSNQLYQRLMTISRAISPTDLSIYSFELATVAPSMFTDDRFMRKSQK